MCDYHSEIIRESYDYITEQSKKRGNIRKIRQVSGTDEFNEGLRKFANDNQVRNALEEIIQLLKNKKERELDLKWKYHELDGKYEGYYSCHLFPGKKNTEVAVFRYDKKDNIILCRIDHHDDIYDPEWPRNKRKKRKKHRKRR